MNASEFEQLLTTAQHLNRIEAIARKNTRGTAVYWEDALQVANLKLLQAVRAGKFREGDVNQFYHWTTRVAKFAIIELVRKEKRHAQTSFDKTITATDLTLLETLPDGSNLLESLEDADLKLKILDCLNQLDRTHPKKHYRQICLGQAEGQTQVELARALGITQSAVSKRIKEVALLVDEALNLGFFSLDTVKHEHQKVRQSQTHRRRSSQQW
jgi:RNA polymerase sigma factor (sigma-70 family)